MSTAETDAGAWTVARLLAWTRDYLQHSGSDAPRLCAEILLAHAMECERIHLYTRFEQVPAEDMLARFRELVKQAATGRPIAYLTGTKEFFALTFEVSPDVLIPRPETEILVERTIDVARKWPRAGGSILDLGTGSGCIAVSLARHLPEAGLFASDISEAVLAVAARNAARHGVQQRIQFRCGDLFEPWNGAESAVGPSVFDIIVCNPPYVGTVESPLDKNVRDFEPPVALFAGSDGLSVIRRIVAEAPRRLKPGGHLLLEVAFDQGTAVRGLLVGRPWQDILTYRDGGGYERVVHARRA